MTTTLEATAHRRARDADTGAAEANALDVRRLVARAQAGDRGALEELYRTHFDRIYGYLRVSVGSQHDAEDLTNQTFIRMLESLDRFVWRKVPFSAWLFRIAHNLAMDHFRAGRRWQPESEVPERPEDLAPSAEEAAFRTIDRERMLGLIRGLSPDQRQVLTLRYVFDFTNGEAAEILGKTENAVKQLQHRAIGSLQGRVAPA